MKKVLIVLEHLQRKTDSRNLTLQTQHKRKTTMSAEHCTDGT